MPVLEVKTCCAMAICLPLGLFVCYSSSVTILTQKLPILSPHCQNLSISIRCQAL